MLSRLAIGTIRTSHGVSGFLKVRSFSGEVEHFTRLRQVYIGGQADPVPYEVEQVLPSKSGEVLLKLKGLDTPEAARRLSGKELWAERQDAAPLKEGEYYLADLAGCRVIHGGAEVGRIRSVIEGGAADLLEVVDAEGRSFLIPFLSKFVGEVDVQHGTIELMEESLLP